MCLANDQNISHEYLISKVIMSKHSFSSASVFRYEVVFTFVMTKLGPQGKKQTKYYVLGNKGKMSSSSNHISQLICAVFYFKQGPSFRGGMGGGNPSNNQN